MATPPHSSHRSLCLSWRFDHEQQTRWHLAQSLRDELGQTLAALRLHRDAQRGTAPDARAAMDDRIDHLIVLANRQVRGMLDELRPPLLDELGLAAAIDHEIHQRQAGTGEARVELLAGDAARRQRWPADVEYAAFMVAREALLDALRHAGARSIRVGLDGGAQYLALRVDDDGRGFAPEAGQGAAGRLSGLRERARAIGARLRIDGAPGHGTMVALTWTPSDDEPHLPG